MSIFYFTSGEISLNANPNLDFETVTQYILTVTCSDTNGLHATQDVTINYLSIKFKLCRSFSQHFAIF